MIYLLRHFVRFDFYSSTKKFKITNNNRMLSHLITHTEQYAIVNNKKEGYLCSVQMHVEKAIAV